MVIWKIGLAILAAANSPPGDILGTAKHVEFLRVLMLQNPEEVRASRSSRLVFRPSARLSPKSQPKASVRLTRPRVSARIAPTGASVIPDAGWTGT